MNILTAEDRKEMNSILSSIESMTAQQCLDFMMYPHQLTIDSPIGELRAEASRQCRLDWEGEPSDADKFEKRFVEGITRIR